VKVSFIYSFVLWFALFSLVGCAVIFTGASQDILLQSDPSDAKVTIYQRNKDKQIGSYFTPTVVRLAKNKRYDFVIEKEGYQQIKYPLESSFNYWFLATIYYFPGLLIDIPYGGYRKFPKQKNFIMRRYDGYVPPQTPPPTTPSTITTVQPKASPIGDIDLALLQAVDQAFREVNTASKIAVIHFQSTSIEVNDFMLGELQHILVTRGYTVADRVDLDALRAERDFHYSSEVDDSTAISLGKYVGADLVVTGGIYGMGNLSRLRLKVIDTQTTIIKGSSSVPFSAGGK